MSVLKGDFSMLKKLRAYLLMLILIILTGMGISIMIKANVGLGPWDALNRTLHYIMGIKVGTVNIILNVICFIGQLVLLNKNFKWINVLQIPNVFLLGHSINFFNDVVFENINIDNYLINIIAFIFATIFIATTIGGIVMLGLPAFSLEGFCNAISETTKIEFYKIRLFFDVFCVGVCVVCTLFFSLDWTLREATLISVIMFSPIMGKIMPKIEKIYKEYDLI